MIWQVCGTIASGVSPDKSQALVVQIDGKGLFR